MTSNNFSPVLDLIEYTVRKTLAAENWTEREWRDCWIPGPMEKSKRLLRCRFARLHDVDISICASYKSNTLEELIWQDSAGGLGGFLRIFARQWYAESFIIYYDKNCCDGGQTGCRDWKLLC